MPQNPEDKDVHVLKIDEDLPRRDDLNIGADEWFAHLMAGNLFPTRYDSRYFQAIKGEKSVNDTWLFLDVNGFTVQAVSGDGVYYLVQPPEDFEFMHNGTGTFRFVRRPVDTADQFLFDSGGIADSIHEAHAFYMIGHDNEISQE